MSQPRSISIPLLIVVSFVLLSSFFSFLVFRFVIALLPSVSLDYTQDTCMSIALILLVVCRSFDWVGFKFLKPAPLLLRVSVSRAGGMIEECDWMPGTLDILSSHQEEMRLVENAHLIIY